MKKGVSEGVPHKDGIQSETRNDDGQTGERNFSDKKNKKCEDPGAERSMCSFIW